MEPPVDRTFRDENVREEESLKVTCYSCGKTLADPGAVIIGPPFKSNNDKSVLTVHKYHICLACWDILIDNLDDLITTAKAKGKN